MSDTEQKTIDRLTQFTKDLEAGDLSGYRITRLEDCPNCNGVGHVFEQNDMMRQRQCFHCLGKCKVFVVIQEQS